MTPAAYRSWWESGERHLATALAGIADADFGAPTLLPGWDRGHLVAHVARNADALVNLLAWARTGVRTPMYASPEARDAEIAETAGLPPASLRSEVRSAAERLAAGVRDMPQTAWAARVRTAQGRDIPASEVLWMRCREVWVHPVDLDAGVTYADIPDDVLAALVDDVFRMWERRGPLPDLAVSSGGRDWGHGTVIVTGPLPAVTAWLTGRSAGEDLAPEGRLPRPPVWL